MFNSITLYNSSKTYLQFSHFPGKFEFLVKSKMAAILKAILDDVTDPRDGLGSVNPFLLVTDLKIHYQAFTTFCQ